MRILITGSSGFLGSLFTTYLAGKHEFICPKREDIDFSNPQLVYDYFMQQDFDVCFHLAANGQTKICEENPELTHKINTQTTNEIAKVCKEKKARLIFFSTEQVYNGQSQGPFTEEIPPKSITNYGLQKIEAEQFITSNLDDYLILRLSWMFGLSSKNIKASPNIIKNVLTALLYRQATLFTLHEHRCMTYAYNLVENFGNILNAPSGILHFATTNTFTTYDAAKYIAKQLKFNEEDIEKYILYDLQRYADSPRDYRLDNTKALKQGFVLGSFEDDVKNCLSDFGYNT